MPRIHNRYRDGTPKSRYRAKVSMLEKVIRGLKRKLTKCTCPYCGFGLKQEYKPQENKE